MRKQNESRKLDPRANRTRMTPKILRHSQTVKFGNPVKHEKTK